MGTNYYLHKPPCPHCGKSDPALHIGKSSGGWVFALHVYPKEASPGVDFFDRSNEWDVTINDLDDWLPLFEQYEIRDEYGTKIEPAMMKAIIAERPRFNGNELKRWPVEHLRVLGPGAGTWDRHVGWFS